MYSYVVSSVSASTIKPHAHCSGKHENSDRLPVVSGESARRISEEHFVFIDGPEPDRLLIRADQVQSANRNGISSIIPNGDAIDL